MRKTKLNLIAALAVGLLAVSTAGVSTYAWFQAQSQVQIDTTESYTNITVNKPESDFEYYAYRGNRTPSHKCGETDVDGDKSYTFSDDFISLTSSNVASETNLESLGFYPGKSFTFALKISSLTASTSTIAFATSKVISNNATKQSLSHERYVKNTTKKVNVGWAINLHAYLVNASTASPSGVSGYTTFVSSNPEDASYLSSYPDKFRFDDSSTGTYAYTLLDNPGDSNKIFSLSLPLVNTTTAAASSAYIFYRVVFSKVDSSLYKEVNDAGAYQIEPVTTADRLFVRYSDGDSENKSKYTSNCYAGLSFALSELAITIL